MAKTKVSAKSNQLKVGPNTKGTGTRGVPTAMAFGPELLGVKLPHGPGGGKAPGKNPTVKPAKNKHWLKKLLIPRD